VELRDYWRLVIRNLPVMAASLLAGIIVSASITFSMTPMYQATSQIFVSTPASSLDISALATGSSFSQQRVKSYAQIINGPATLQPVIDFLELDETASSLSKRVTASAPLDTVLITLKVSDESAIMAAKIANAVARQFSLTVASLEISQSGSGSSPVKVSTVKDAVTPTSPSSPKKALNLALGILLGLGLGLALAIIRQIFDTSIKTEEDLMGLTLLAAIPFDKEAATKPLLTQLGRYASRAESYRQLRTNLQFIRPDSPARVIAVTSAMPGEGKTTTSINIALAMKQAGSKVVLIEADLRRPKAYEYLKTPKHGTGLSELLSGIKPAKTFDQIDSLLIEVAEGVKVLSSGAIPPNPAELLNSDAMTSLLSILKEHFDYVIIDCPPLLPITDGALIAAKSDGVLLVVRAASTKTAQLKGSVEALTAVGSGILGVELNMIPQNRSYYDYGYKYGYYSYGKRGYGAKTQSNNTYAPNQD
jgi:succinoglycan biosynthesis transport protein ExoP